jgi:thiamine kinase-like enzyme
VKPVDAIYNAAMWERYLEAKRDQAKQEPSDTSLLSTSPEEVKRQIEQFNERRENGIHIVV